MKKYSTITIGEETATKFRITRTTLGCKNSNELIALLLQMRDKNGWSKIDCEIIGTYGLEKYLKLSEMAKVKTARSDAEMKKQIESEYPDIKNMPKSELK